VVDTAVVVLLVELSLMLAAQAALAVDHRTQHPEDRVIRHPHLQAKAAMGVRLMAAAAVLLPQGLDLAVKAETEQLLQ
jgi:hypothetical protein